MFDLPDPQLSAKDSQNIRTLVTTATNQSHVLKPIADQEPCDVTLKGLPWADEQSALVEKTGHR
jgi:hypothetical protein